MRLRQPSSDRPHPAPTPRQGRRAFTLIEAIATISILAVVLSSTSRLILVATNGYTQSAVRNQLHVELSITLDRAARELQQVALKSGGGMKPDITSVTASSITWNTDYTLTLSGSTLMFTDNGATPRVLLDNVSAFSIQCYDESNAALAASLSSPATDNVRRITVSISSTRSGVTETLRTKLFLRACMAGGGS